MNRRAAVRHLHQRHPQVIDATAGEVDLEALHLEVFWFQGHACELLDARAEDELRRCFATIEHVLVEGDPEVKHAVCKHFVLPHLATHPDLAWARERMPPGLAFLCGVMRGIVDQQHGRRPAGGAGA